MTRRTLTQDELNAIYREPWCDPACRLLIQLRIESGEWMIIDTPRIPGHMPGSPSVSHGATKSPLHIPPNPAKNQVSGETIVTS